VFIDVVSVLLNSVQNYTFLLKNVTFCPIIFQKNSILLQKAIFLVARTIKKALRSFI